MKLEGIIGGLAAERAAAKKIRMKLAALLEAVGEGEREGLMVSLGAGDRSIALNGTLPNLKITVCL